MAAQLKVVVEPTQLVEGVLLQADPSVEIRRVLPGAAQAVDDVRDLSLQDEDGVEDFLLALDALLQYPNEQSKTLLESEILFVSTRFRTSQTSIDGGLADTQL